MAKSARDIPDAIQWHEGMLLAPQHFQEASLRAESLVAYHQLAAQPYHWGVQHLQTDPVKLAAGEFSILSLEAVLPDGLVLSFDHRSDPHGLTIDLEEHKETLAKRPLTLFLAVPKHRPGAPLTDGEDPRYRGDEGPMIPDNTTGEGEMRLPRLIPRPRLHAGETLPDRLSGFPIARIHLQGEAFAETKFVPAQLAVSRASPIGEVCQKLATRLREKAIYLAERAGSPVGQADQPMLIRSQMMINGLVSALPPFEALLKTDRAHPFTLYLSLCQVVGSMVIVGGAGLSPAFDAYDHTNPLKSFTEAIDFAVRMLDRVSEAYTAIPFTDADDVFSLVLEEAWCRDDLTIGVRARHDMTEQDVVAWVDAALIGTESALPEIEETRVLGASRVQLERERALDLVPTRGVVLFRITADPAHVIPGERLLVLSRDPGSRAAPQEIVLYIRNAAGRAD